MRTAVTSMSIGVGSRPMRNLTYPAMMDYADRIGADFVNINAGFGKLFQGNVYFEKLQLINLLEHYDRIIYLDTDIIVSPDCPSLLELVPEDHLGAFIASRYSNVHNQANIEIQRTLGTISWRREQRDTQIFESFNAGVLILSKQLLPELRQVLPAAETWSRYEGPIDPRALMAEQPVWNYTLQKFQIPITDLGLRFNHTNARGSSNDRFSSHIIHYAGTSHRQKNRLFTTSKLTKMKIDAAIIGVPWLNHVAKRSTGLIRLLDRLV